MNVTIDKRGSAPDLHAADCFLIDVCFHLVILPATAGLKEGKKPPGINVRARFRSLRPRQIAPFAFSLSRQIFQREKPALERTTKPPRGLVAHRKTRWHHA